MLVYTVADTEVRTPGEVACSLIEAEHVRSALQADKGSDAHLVSWALKDFTKKDDNLTSVVKVIDVEYSLQGAETQTSSYVVKINPSLKENEYESFTHQIFTKESSFLRDLAPKLSSLVAAAGQRPLAFPAHLFSRMDEGREFIIMEDLRRRGFRTRNRLQSLDVAHTTLVMQELARIHAASFLLQARQPTRKLADAYEFLKADWANFTGEKRATFQTMFSDCMADAMTILENVGGYEKVTEWMERSQASCMDVMEAQVSKDYPFEVLCHGDLWTCNLMFRYDDDDETPVEVAVIDLQMVRMASPGTELSNLFYTSLDNHVRKPNLEAFLKAYYASFAATMAACGADVPFSFEELEKEYKKRLKYGLYFAIMDVPMILTDATDVPLGEDFLQRWRQKGKESLPQNPLIKSSFPWREKTEEVQSSVWQLGLTVPVPCKPANASADTAGQRWVAYVFAFETMEGDGAESDFRPSEITQESVEAALKNDKGSDARLVSFAVQECTKKGDNYATLVARVISQLQEAGQSPLRVPRCFHTSLEEFQEVIFLEDLRPKGFKMFDRKKGMDVAHTKLVLEELARLHAASYLLKAKIPDLAEKYPVLNLDWLNYADDAGELMYKTLSTQMDIVKDMLNKVGGYEVAENWLSRNRERVLEILGTNIERVPPFAVLCHGDCWNNNVLFRYNEEGVPVEVMLLDLQMCRLASLATDLTYLFHTSLEGHVRKTNLESFLDTYFSAFLAITKAGKTTMPFTRQELRQEYKNRLEYGLLLALVVTVMVICEGDVNKEDQESFSDSVRDILDDLVATSPILRSRFLSMFDEMMENGVIQ
ncbi:hypothetical protein C7M84_010599 [Penaeus vannamei]|uniref:CHK kinase-like domain-containing protein n=1 Tax=Penaeus vannamei TaxID=6689 RepID=A0A423T3J2_PENVA|nr:hypothetical protein C7M84_010599 [Penaeus vannamei]